MCVCHPCALKAKTHSAVLGGGSSRYLLPRRPLGAFWVNVMILVNLLILVNFTIVVNLMYLVI